jgi:sugar lactone lactonase YvrE
VVAISLGPNGSIYILDNGNDRVVKWAPGFTSGTIVAGGSGQGSNSNQLHNPFGMFLDSSTSFIWIPDSYNNRIVRWESPSIVVIVCGSYGTNAHQFNQPAGLFVDTNSANTLYVADTYNHRIQMWLPGATNGTTVAGQTAVSGSALNQLSYPQALLVDTNGYMYIVDEDNNRIMRWMIGLTAGVIIAGSSTSGNLPYQLSTPKNIRFNSRGDLLVADMSNNRIQKFSISCGKLQNIIILSKLK